MLAHFLLPPRCELVLKVALSLFMRLLVSGSPFVQWKSFLQVLSFVFRIKWRITCKEISRKIWFCYFGFLCHTPSTIFHASGHVPLVIGQLSLCQPFPTFGPLAVCCLPGSSHIQVTLSPYFFFELILLYKNSTLKETYINSVNRKLLSLAIHLQ